MLITGKHINSLLNFLMKNLGVGCCNDEVMSFWKYLRFNYFCSYKIGLVVQLNRTSDSGSESHRFESCRGHKGDSGFFKPSEKQKAFFISKFGKNTTFDGNNFTKVYCFYLKERSCLSLKALLYLCVAAYRSVFVLQFENIEYQHLYQKLILSFYL